MKLRIRGNSVRMRLLKNEAASLAESSRIAETVSFGPTKKEILTYAIQISEKASEVTAGFCENEVCIILPQTDARKWLESEQIGISAEVSNDETTLSILVEKDFVCLTRTDDPDNINAYPNPESDC